MYNVLLSQLHYVDLVEDPSRCNESLWQVWYALVVGSRVRLFLMRPSAVPLLSSLSSGMQRIAHEAVNSKLLG